MVSSASAFARLVGLASGLVVGSIGLIASAEPQLRMEWTAPAACPDGVVVRREVEARLGPGPHPTTLEVDGVVVRGGRGYLLRLQMRSGISHADRRLDAVRCETLTQAGALVIALAIDPEAVIAQQAPDPTIAPAPTPSPPPPSPAPPRPAPPDVRPTPPPSEAPRPPARRGSPPAHAAARDVSAARRSAGDEARGPSLGAAIGFAGDYGSLVGFAPGVHAAVGVGVDAYRIEAILGLWPSSEATSASSPNRGARLALVAGGARGCRRLLPWRASDDLASLRACVGLELGRISGTGFGVSAPSSAGAFWIAPGADVEARLALARPIGLLADVGFVVPLLRRTFVLEVPDRTALHEPAPVALRLSVGLDARF